MSFQRIANHYFLKPFLRQNQLFARNHQLLVYIRQLLSIRVRKEKKYR